MMDETTQRLCNEMKQNIIEILENMERVYAKHLEEELLKDG